MNGVIGAGYTQDDLEAEFGDRWTFTEDVYLDGVMIVAKPFPPVRPFLAVVEKTPAAMAKALRDQERQLRQALSGRR